jgi:phage-related protein
MSTLRDVYEIMSRANTSGIDQTTNSVEKSTSALGKLGEIGGKITGGLAVAGMALEGLKSIGETVGGLFEKLAESSPEFAGALEGVQGAFAGVKNALMAPIASALTPILEKVTELLSSPAFTTFIDEIAVALGEVFAMVGDILVSDLLPVLMDLVQGVLPPLLDVIRAILPPLGDLLRAILPPLVGIITKLAEVFGAVLEAILPVIVQIAEALIPPLLDLIDQLLPVLLPLIEQLAGMFAEVLTALAPLIAEGLALLLPLLVDLLEWILPPLIELFTWLADKVSGVLTDALTWLRDFIANDLGPIFEWLNEKILQPVIGAFEKIVSVVQEVLGWLGDLWASLESAADALPDWLIPGSPTPLENGIRGIAAALKDLQMPNLGGIVAAPFGGMAGAAAGAGLGGIIVNVNGPFGEGYTPYEAGQQAGHGLADTLRSRGLL